MGIEPTPRSLIPPHRKRWGILSFFVKTQIRFAGGAVKMAAFRQDHGVVIARIDAEMRVEVAGDGRYVAPS